MRTLKLYLLEAKYEFLKLWRAPGYTLPTLGFPLFFYLFFGVLFAQKSNAPLDFSKYLLATYGTMGVVGATLFGFGVGVSTERSLGWLQLKRTTPMPVSAYFAGKLIMSVLFGAIVALSLFVMGATLAHVRFPLEAWALMLVILVIGSIPFAALGLAIGYLATPGSAPAVINLVYLPTAFLSGLWLPFDFLPKLVQKVGVWLPQFHLSQMALGVIGVKTHGTFLMHLAALGAYATAFLLIAMALYKRDERTA